MAIPRQCQPRLKLRRIRALGNWVAILRLYGPLEPWFDKTWRPGDIVEIA